MEVTFVPYMRVALSWKTERENGIALSWGGLISKRVVLISTRESKEEIILTSRLLWLYLVNNKSLYRGAKDDS